jgi:hypothetical protein
VRTWALDSLATFAAKDSSLLPLVARSLEAFQRRGNKALAARARHIRDRLGLTSKQTVAKRRRRGPR